MAKITKESRTIVIALLLGNGKIVDNTLVLKHDDKEYLEYIRHALKKHGINTTNVIDFHNIDPKDFTNFKIEDFATNETELQQITNRDFSQLPRYGLRTYKHKFMSVYKCMTYGGKIRKRWLNRFLPLHLAILYMEIGSIVYKRNENNIHTVNLLLKTLTTQEYNQIIIDWLQERWNLSFFQKRYHDQYILCCGANTARRFCRIIAKYICPSMEYKLINTD